MALSMSVSAGAHNTRHNTDLAYRANLRNVDADLSVGNISIRDVPIAEACETVFGDIEGKERTVARLDRSIETKTKRLASELDGRFY